MRKQCTDLDAVVFIKLIVTTLSLSHVKQRYIYQKQNFRSIAQVGPILLNSPRCNLDDNLLIQVSDVNSYLTR